MTLTDQQVAAVFTTLLGLPPRAADLAVLHALAPDGLSIEEVAAYIHDHIGGSPASPTLQEVEAAVRSVTEAEKWRA